MCEYSDYEIRAAAARLHRQYGDQPIALGPNGWSRLIRIALEEITAHRERMAAALASSPQPAPAGEETTTETEER